VSKKSDMARASAGVTSGDRGCYQKQRLAVLPGKS